jgi:hypothetical protein
MTKKNAETPDDLSLLVVITPDKQLMQGNG